MTVPDHPLFSTLEHNLDNPQALQKAMQVMCEQGGIAPKEAELILSTLVIRAVEATVKRVRWEMGMNETLNDDKDQVFDRVRTNARVSWTVTGR